MDRAHAGSQQGICAFKHCLPNRACTRPAGKSMAGTAGPKLPGFVTAVSKQHFHPTHMRLRHTLPPPEGWEQGEARIPPLKQGWVCRWAPDSTQQDGTLSPRAKIPNRKRNTISSFSSEPVPTKGHGRLTRAECYPKGAALPANAV